MTDEPDRTIFCLAGTPGAGKSTIRRELLRAYPADVIFLSRVTTRPVRRGEEGEVITLPRGAFICGSHAGEITARFCSNNAMYGVSVTELRRLLLGSQRWIGCISASAGLALQDKGFSVSIIYLAVSHREVLVERLWERGHDARDIEIRMHEFDDADAEWRDLSGDAVLFTDEYTIPETLQRVVEILDLPQ